MSAAPSSTTIQNQSLSPQIMLTMRTGRQKPNFGACRKQVIESLSDTKRPSSCKTSIIANNSNFRLIDDRASLIRSNHELKHFAACAAHELKSPLNAALAWLREVRNQIDQKNERNFDEALGVIERNIRKSIHHVNEVLNLAKQESTVIQQSKCDTNAILNHVMETFSALIKDRGATITRGNMPIINANKHQIECVFSNLIDNALKYRRVDEPLSIHIECIDKTSEYRFIVTDNGIGIARDHLEVIFNLFSKIPRADLKTESTGIGLAYCKKVITLHGGNIWAESTLGNGSSFIFTIPK